ncbi:MAG: ArsR family transcriptional regulator [Phycisphaerales bacterium]|nr:MAG: ArsR family transcriptional regulator [Phycisphaerales bacterium]
MMDSERKAFADVTTPGQWDAVCSLARLELLETFSSHGACSIAELAHWLDRPADGLYHHVRKLVRAGLVREVDVRKVGRHRESVFDMVADELRFDVDPEQGRNMDRLEQIARAHLKRAERLLASAAAARAVRLARPGKNTHVRGDEAWLSDEELERVNEIVDELRSVFAGAKRRRTGNLHAFTLVISPVVRERGASARPTSRQQQMDMEQKETGA